MFGVKTLLRRRLAPLVVPAEHRIGMDTCLQSLAARGFAPRTIFDVGAAAGDWSRLARTVWPQVEIVLFEPLPIGDREASLAELTSGQPKAQLVEAGVGRASGTLTISVGADADGSSFAYSAGGGERVVDVVALDDLVAPSGDLPQPDLLKLDVQGFELEALAGAERMLAQTELVILEARLFGTELPLVVEVLEYMRSRGFELLEIADVLRRPHDGAMAECDLVFARSGTKLVSLGGWTKPQPAPPPRPAPRP